MRSDISNLKDASARKRSLTDSANQPAETFGGEVVKCHAVGQYNEVPCVQRQWLLQGVPARAYLQQLQELEKVPQLQGHGQHS